MIRQKLNKYMWVLSGAALLYAAGLPLYRTSQNNTDQTGLSISCGMKEEGRPGLFASAVCHLPPAVSARSLQTEKAGSDTLCPSRFPVIWLTPSASAQFHQLFSNRSFPAPHTGQTQSAGSSSKGISPS